MDSDLFDRHLVARGGFSGILMERFSVCWSRRCFMRDLPWGCGRWCLLSSGRCAWMLACLCVQMRGWARGYAHCPPAVVCNKCSKIPVRTSRSSLRLAYYNTFCWHGLTGSKTSRLAGVSRVKAVVCALRVSTDSVVCALRVSHPFPFPCTLTHLFCHFVSFEPSRI